MDRDELRDCLLKLRKRLDKGDLKYAIEYLEEKRRSEKKREESPIRFMENYCKFDPERVYLLMAIARAKDNPLSSSEEIVFREVIRNKREIQEKYSKLRSIVNGCVEGGKSYNFRLHLSVNARNTTKAYFNFRGRMNGWVEDKLRGDENYEKFKNLDRRWLSELSRPSSKDETNFLVDLDDDDELAIDEARELLAGYTVVQVKRRTPNGFHLVTNPFDYSDLPTELDIKTDALLFLEYISGGKTMETERVEKILPNSLEGLEKRDYQVNMYEEVRENDSLLVLPTGLGKTVVALFLISEKLESSGGPIFFLAPSKPLCEQHSEMLEENLEADVKVVTGETHKPSKRKEIWKSSDVFVATPQTVQNDLEEGRLSLENCPLIVFDEAHRATGDYSYVKVNKMYCETANSPQVLGLTASPGNDLDSLKEVAENLKLEKVSIRDETDPDVRPYLGEKLIEKVELEKTPSISKAEGALEFILRSSLEFLSSCSGKAERIDPKTASPKDLNKIMSDLQSHLKSEKSRQLYKGVSRAAAAIKLAHLKGLVTTQGFEPASKFVDKLRNEDTKASSYILRHPKFGTVRRVLGNAKPGSFPKVQRAMKISGRHLRNHPNGKIMIFTKYRATVELLSRELSRELTVEPEILIGQAKSEGMTQKEQKETLERFERGEFNTLVSTRIGEEGIDIPMTSLVLFYEPIPSAVRRIQRKGRTARDGRAGEVKILVMKGTRDEPYYWKGVKGEKKLYRKAREFGNGLEEKKEGLSLEDFI